ncbi:CPBP family intramembrane glutamic endopeptidase [Halobellus sp. EA9]|uniref:CPBP family intramembrane glutamic endopeptidase n=1 Tax=Halobellus sp. EA9 TaxID=3421647 RepID=UPI003EBAAF57
MPEWATFAGFAFVVTAGLLLLSHASKSILQERPDDVGEPPANHHLGEPTSDTVCDATSSGSEESITLPKSGVEFRVRQERSPDDVGEPQSRLADVSTASLLANVAVSQGIFGVVLLAGAWYAEIPARAFGLAPERIGLGAAALGVGVGLVLYAANEAGAAAGAQFGLGVGDGERLRSALAPETAGGWALLLLVVLPVIAGFEELLFRGALVGVVSAGYGISPWVLAVVSSVAFALGHGAQGRLGVVVTGTLGFVLAATFVVTGSLLVVIVAHYLINALEFVVHEGFGVEWPSADG